MAKLHVTEEEREEDLKEPRGQKEESEVEEVRDHDDEGAARGLDADAGDGEGHDSPPAVRRPVLALKQTARSAADSEAPLSCE